MTAGAGILHIETPPEHLVISGGLFHGFQLWVNLPRGAEVAEPRYQDIRGARGRRCWPRPDGGALVRVIAGERRRAAAARARRTRRSRWSTRRSPPGAQLTLPWRPTSTRWSTCWPARARSAPTRRPVRDRPAGGVRRGRHGHRRAPMPAGRAHPGAGRAACSAGGRSASRSPVRPVRDEHRGRAAPGVRGLPGRPAGHDPRPVRLTRDGAAPGAPRNGPRPLHGRGPRRVTGWLLFRGGRVIAWRRGRERLEATAAGAGRASVRGSQWWVASVGPLKTAEVAEHRGRHA